MADWPEPGDIGLIGKHRGAWYDKVAEAAIRFGTNSPVCHAFLYAGEDLIVEAVRTVRFTPVTFYDDIIWSTGRLGSLTPTAGQRKTIVSAAVGYIGESYNLADIAAIALAQQRLGHLVDGDEWWVKRLSDDGKLICSQLVDAAYRQAGIALYPDRLPGLVSPGDLLNLFQKEPS